jgi:hypothetical protein
MRRIAVCGTLDVTSPTNRAPARTPKEAISMITPKAVTETTPIVTAHSRQRDLVVASILAVPFVRPEGEKK